jgi:hypothetical protein
MFRKLGQSRISVPLFRFGGAAVRSSLGCHISLIDEDRRLSHARFLDKHLAPSPTRKAVI